MSDDLADPGRHRREPDDVLDLAFLYALDAVDADERADIEARIAGADLATRTEFGIVVRDVHQTMALSASAVAVAPPEALRDRILDAVAALDDRPAAPVVSLDAQRNRRRSRMRIAVAAAAAAVVVAVGGVVVSQQLGTGPSSPTSEVLQASDVRTSTVDVTGGGTATVRWSRAENAAVVTFDGLVSPEQGKVFEMWLIEPEISPDPRPVGLVEPVRATPDVEHLVTDLGQAGTFAVSVEPAAGSPAPTTTPIAAVVLDA